MLDLKLLKCFVAVANELHFGRAAQSLDILPSALGRNIRLLEEDLGLRLLNRTTRNVTLTKSGHLLLSKSRPLLEQADALCETIRSGVYGDERVFRIGAIDSAATGLLAELIHDFKELAPDIELVLVEDKTSKLLPKLLSGALDVAFVRPPPASKSGVEFDFLLNEPTVVALSKTHKLSRKKRLLISDLKDEPLIVPSPRNRPYSYNLSTQLFINQGLQPNVVQQVEEKQTTIRLVGAGIGIAIIPYWSSKIGGEGVVYRPLVDKNKHVICELPLAAAWVRGWDDPMRDTLLKVTKTNLSRYAGEYYEA
jgi:DNA-binding transcriptional LysR family regulator